MMMIASWTTFRFQRRECVCCCCRVVYNKKSKKGTFFVRAVCFLSSFLFSFSALQKKGGGSLSFFSKKLSVIIMDLSNSSVFGGRTPEKIGQR